MKILWGSNWFAQSAYAQQSNMFVPLLRKAGHDMMVFNLSNGVGKPQIDDGIPVIGVGYDALGNDMITHYVSKHQIDAVITLVDVWRFQPEIWQGVPFYPWTPVDHKPVPAHVVKPLKSARKIIAMSRYGQDELTQSGFTDVLYLPHATDPEIFHPRTESKRAATRKTIGVTDNQFLVTFVGVNDSGQSRKGIPEMLMAWKFFSDAHPDAVLYMHTMMHGNLPINSIGGVRIDALVNTLNIRGDSLRMVNQDRYKACEIPQTEVADLMAAANVHLLATRGEGFGIPVIEAQRCGTPVITTNFAATSRLLFAGWHIDYEAEWSYWQDAFMAKPGVMSILECLENAYAARDDERLRKLAELGATEFDIDTVMRKHMLPALDKIAEDVLERAAA